MRGELRFMTERFLDDVETDEYGVEDGSLLRKWLSRYNFTLSPSDFEKLLEGVIIEIQKIKNQPQEHGIFALSQ